MDKLTEIVAHMIGIFHTTLEEERMRDVYEEFQAARAADPELEEIVNIQVTFKAKHSLEEYTPDLPNMAPAPVNLIDQIGNFFNAGFFFPVPVLAPILNTFSALPEVASFYTQLSVNFGGEPIYIMEPPSSIMLVSSQTAVLSDNDLLLLGEGDTTFTDPYVYELQLVEYQSIAEELASPVSGEVVVPGENALQDAIALLKKISVAEASTMEGASTTMLHGTDVSGTHVDGEDAEEAPEIEDVLPTFLADDEEDEAAEEIQVASEDDKTQTATEDTVVKSSTLNTETGTFEDTTDDKEAPDPFKGLNEEEPEDGLPEVEDGVEIVTGGNALVNEVALNSSWMDASVISVMGDVVNLDVISQVNVLSDKDTVVSEKEAVSECNYSGSVAINSATLSDTSSTLEEEEDELTEEPQLEYSSEFPSNWAISRVEGDLVSFNHITQYSFAMDHDRAEVTHTSQDMYVSTGENVISNVANIAEFGFNFDLIMITGSMIAVNWISQMNVVIDNDSIEFADFNPGGVSKSDNLLINKAQIKTIGKDSYKEMNPNFEKGSKGLGNGDKTIDETVAHDSLFEGFDLLRVLYVEGDLTTVNWIDQTNILGDSDQVHLAFEEFQDTMSDMFSLTTGSNAAINVASINHNGVDSTVAVGGEVYDDALLYQAELIDTDADPLGVDLDVDMAALANEAVAFLADNMLDPDVNFNDDPITATAAESNTSSDVMQTMLA